MSAEKKARMNKILKLESNILKLEQWEQGDVLDSELEYTIGKIEDVKQRDAKVKFLKENIELMKTTAPDDHKLYLSEIIKLEKPKFGRNNLILAPVGSGKSTVIKDILVNNAVGKVLILVSNTTLKDHVCPTDLEARKLKGHRMFTSGDLTRFGEQGYNIHVMTYSEFGNRIKTNNDFAEDIVQIYCDEVHSLPEYQGYTDNAALSHAIKYLFDVYDDKYIFYFTATDENLKILAKKQKSILRNVITFDYRTHPNIKQYMVLSEYKINHVEQIRPHLKARIKSFTYFGYKGLAYSRTIAGQNKIAEMAIGEGFNPLVLWSVNNENEGKIMNEIQIKAREELINTGIIPDPYNLLIINSAMREGWDLIDDKIKLAIMNSTNETEHIQALGRIRNDIDVLIYRTNDTEKVEVKIDLPIEYLDVFLTTKDKSSLCELLNLIDGKGRIMAWKAIKILLINNLYEVKDTKRLVDGKRLTVSKITKMNS